MARATIELVRALRVTAERLSSDTSYQWGHMGACNCGHLAQTITRRSKREIHESAMVREGDWEQQAHDYCPTSGHCIDDIITELIAAGMSIHDIGHLEKLSDPEVLARMPEGLRAPRHNVREHVVVYMATWADMLEERVPPAVPELCRAAA